MNKEELSKMKVSELKTIADEKNIDIKGLKKDEIIHLLTKEEEKEVKNPNENMYCEGILDIMDDGFGFLRFDDIFVSPSFIRKLRLRTGDYIIGKKRAPKEGERYESLTYIDSINFKDMSSIRERCQFEHLTTVSPYERIRL